MFIRPWARQYSRSRSSDMKWSGNIIICPYPCPSSVLSWCRSWFPKTTQGKCSKEELLEDILVCPCTVLNQHSMWEHLIVKRPKQLKFVQAKLTYLSRILVQITTVTSTFINIHTEQLPWKRSGGLWLPLSVTWPFSDSSYLFVCLGTTKWRTDYCKKDYPSSISYLASLISAFHAVLYEPAQCSCIT